MGGSELLDEAACWRHRALSPTAWEDVENGWYGTRGAAAMLVCRFECPITETCKKKIFGEDIVAGGGWYTASGEFREIPAGMMDAQMAAAVLGVAVERVQRWMGNRLKTVAKYHGRALYKQDDVFAIGRDPAVHGTNAARYRHERNGEDPCSRCNRVFAGKRIRRTKAVV